MGTRPEIIKLAPIMFELKKYNDLYNVFICNTEQQKELSHQTLQFFNLVSNFNLGVMTFNQQLGNTQSQIMLKLSSVFDQINFDATIVQGDTLTAFCGALMSFYKKVPIFHIEAGLRALNKFEPFPEEAMRQMTARITDLHFSPTLAAKNNLLKENIDEEIIDICGNTVIDALDCLDEKVLNDAKIKLGKINIVLNEKLILVTIHRRENHNERLLTILSAILDLATNFKDHQFILPMHPNPNVRNIVITTLSSYSNIILVEPLTYPELVLCMKHAKLILTDSGGIQEEAPTFHVPVLVLRYTTERMEGVEAKFAQLVGANKELIFGEAHSVLSKTFSETRVNLGKDNPYGDGNASKRIIQRINKFYSDLTKKK
jgi:UDP-N-acetylglucosamine 2-epimerase (non-hydrolysing)